MSADHPDFPPQSTPEPKASSGGERDISVANEEGKQGMEMTVSPPAILPPSPPLTANGSQLDEKEVAREDRGEDSRIPEEEDIATWRSSADGSYHEDDLGYATTTAEPTPIDRANGFGSHSRRPSGEHSTQLDFQHPLRLDVHPPSPPPWELVEPPETNNSHISPSRLHPNIGRHGRKATTTRPLIPHSSYYFGPPPLDAAYGSNPIGQLGLHHPREIVRIERDYSGGELVQFASVYPLELEGRISPTQFLETINIINERLISAHSLRHSFVDSCIAFFTLQLSKLILTPHYEKEMQRLRLEIDDLNKRVYNSVGLNILWPQKIAFLFLEIEYY